MDPLEWTIIIVLSADWVLRLGLALRVIMRRRSVGVSLAWLSVILLMPLVGAAVYLLVGENRLGNKRAKHAIGIHDQYRYWQAALRTHSNVDWATLDPASESLSRHAESVVGMPPLPGSHLELIDEPEGFFAAIIDDIDRARHRCHLQFYIWADEGRTDDVVLALLRAAERGIECRLLIDAVGGRGFLTGENAASLRAAGVEVVAALPVKFYRLAMRRLDLRNHRKIVVLDGRVAYTGSQNMADPRFFKKEQGVGAWIDAMVRIEGPVVTALEGIFLKDWELETGRGFQILRETKGEIIDPFDGGAVVQVVPSGPGFRNDAIHHLLLSTIASARERIILTTPYFVPDESINDALVCAAHRGIAVELIVPEHVDSMLVRYAGRSHWIDLLQAGARIRTFDGGLLHTKAITVDDRFSLIGSVNLDMRSFWLNFELSLFVYDRNFTERLVALQESYMNRSGSIDAKAWANRPLRMRLLENTVRLASPLL